MALRRGKYPKLSTPLGKLFKITWKIHIFNFPSKKYYLLAGSAVGTNLR
jgi:hypothetical protein